MSAGLHNNSLSVAVKSGRGPIARAERVGLRGGRFRQYTLIEKLLARVVKRPNGCWECQGYADPRSGYVQISIGSPAHPPYKRRKAHIVAWEHFNGRSVPDGLAVMHSCDNPRCCNPEHLSVGTHRDNVLDSVAKGRFCLWRHTGFCLDGSPAKWRLRQSDATLHAVQPFADDRDRVGKFQQQGSGSDGRVCHEQHCA